MAKNTGGPASACSVCGDSSVIKQGHQWLCEKHYRFGQMRNTAKRHGKPVPERSHLETMKGSDLVCPDCGVDMNWRQRDGAHTVASLQHYRNGEMAIVCLSCNTRHASMEGDSYREMPKDHKHCPSCKQVKPLTEFALDSCRQGVAKRKSHCRDCSKQSGYKWRKENREQYNAYQRAYRAKRKTEGRPVTRSN